MKTEGLTPKPLSRGVSRARHHREIEVEKGGEKKWRKGEDGGGGDKMEKKSEEKEGEKVVGERRENFFMFQFSAFLCNTKPHFTQTHFDC